MKRNKVVIDQSLNTTVDRNVFIANAIEDEVVEYKVVKKIKEGFAGVITKWVEKSQERVKPICDVYLQCGGCQLMHRNYENQLKIKKASIEKASAYLKLKIHDVVKTNPYFYRNKLIASYQKQNGKIVSGLYSQFSHQLIPIQKCFLHDEKGETILQTITETMNTLRLDVFNEDRKTGFLRHVIIRRAIKDDQTMVTIVVGQKNMQKLNLLKNEILKKVKVDCIVANINARQTSVLLSNEEIVLFGKGYIQDTLCGFKFNISSQSFYQINHSQTEKLYEKAIQLANLQKTDVVLDAYSGIGTIGIVLSPKVKQVLSVELNKDASKDAMINVKLNQLNNVKIINEDATKYIEYLAKSRQKIDVVIMDPTRSGSTPQFIEACRKLNVKKVVYISCNPLTQIRDIALFKKCGYQTKEMFLYDLFPNTNHVETVALLCRKDIDSHIEVKLELGEEDVTKAESKGTYENIKEYILSKYGFKVSTLYIAQIKRKCGLELGENYNKSKKENSKVPECPKEKEDAIMDALRHFGMIVQEG